MAFSRSGRPTTSEPSACRTVATVTTPGEGERAALDRGHNGHTTTALPHSTLLRQLNRLHAGPSPGPAICAQHTPRLAIRSRFATAGKRRAVPGTTGKKGSREGSPFNYRGLAKDGSLDLAVREAARCLQATETPSAVSRAH